MDKEDCPICPICGHIIKKCEICGKQISLDRRFCSPKCSALSRAKPPRFCPVCKKRIPTKNNIYCSRECQRKRTDIHTLESKPCEFCGKILRPSDYKNNYQFNRVRFCSNECSVKSRASEKKDCPVCGEKIQRSDARFCSRKCQKSSALLFWKDKKCEYCGKQLKPKKTRRIRFCGTRCSNNYSHQKRMQAKLKVVDGVTFKRCSNCGDWLEENKYKTKSPKKAARHSICPKCLKARQKKYMRSARSSRIIIKDGVTFMRCMECLKDVEIDKYKVNKGKRIKTCPICLKRKKRASRYCSAVVFNNQ